MTTLAKQQLALTSKQHPTLTNAALTDKSLQDDILDIGSDRGLSLSSETLATLNTSGTKEAPLPANLVDDAIELDDDLAHILPVDDPPFTLAQNVSLPRVRTTE